MKAWGVANLSKTAWLILVSDLTGCTVRKLTVVIGVSADKSTIRALFDILGAFNFVQVVLGGRLGAGEKLTIVMRITGDFTAIGADF